MAPERSVGVTVPQLVTFKAISKRKRRIAKTAFIGSRMSICMATIDSKSVFE
jgi:hypothetical protein